MNALSRPQPSRVQSVRSTPLIMSPGARSIVQAALRDDVSVMELAEMAAVDPAFALRVLAVANSSAYGLSRKVATVEHAAALLGIRGLRNIALGMLVADLVPAAEGAACFLSNCLRRAVAAREIAVVSGLASPDDGFFAGLLLEVGLLHQACDHFDLAVQVARAPGRHRPLRERAYGLLPHPQLGQSLARELSLPETMAQAIVCHHDVNRPQDALSAVCWASEFVASVLETGHEAHTLHRAEAALDSLALGVEIVHSLVERVPSEVAELSRALDCAAGAEHEGGKIRRGIEDDLSDLDAQCEQMAQILESVLGERDQLRAELQAALPSRPVLT